MCTLGQEKDSTTPNALLHWSSSYSHSLKTRFPRFSCNRFTGTLTCMLHNINTILKKVFHLSETFPCFYHSWVMDEQHTLRYDKTTNLNAVSLLQCWVCLSILYFENTDDNFWQQDGMTGFREKRAKFVFLQSLFFLAMLCEDTKNSDVHVKRLRRETWLDSAPTLSRNGKLNAGPDVWFSCDDEQM